MYHTLLHFSRLCCRPQAVCAPLKVLSRQTTPRTHNVFDRAISHRSDLGSFYQVMNTWKRLHCFFFSPQQCHCLFFLAAHQTTAILSTSQRENKKDKSSIVDFDKLIIPSRFLQGGKKRYECWWNCYLLSLKGHLRQTGPLFEITGPDRAHPHSVVFWGWLIKMSVFW